MNLLIKEMSKVKDQGIIPQANTAIYSINSTIFVLASTSLRGKENQRSVERSERMK